MKRSRQYIETEKKYGAHNYDPIPVVISESRGVWVWDTEGRKYLDCLSSYSAVNHGHRHPEILRAMEEQMGRLTLTSRAFYNDRLPLFLRRLCQVTEMEAVLPMNTGAEAVETAIKIARKWGYEKKGVRSDRAEIIVCENNFHGRTTTIVGFSSDKGTRNGFGPFTPGFKRIPFDDTEGLEKAITPDTVAFLVEPIQGEAGVIVPGEGYLGECRRICREMDVLLLLDEIQTGFGRTGKMFAYMHEDAKPDILIMGKALGGGVFPVSAVASRREVMDVIGPGDHGSTFGGNPLGCAVALEALNVLTDEELPSRAERIGAYFTEGLRGIGTDKLKEIRGKGLLIAVELKKEYGTARDLCLELIKEGVLAKDTHGQTVRFAPPLIVTEEEIDLVTDALRKLL